MTDTLRVAWRGTILAMTTAIKLISFPISPYKALCTIVRIKLLRHDFKTDSTVTLVGPKMWQPLVFQRWRLLFCKVKTSKVAKLSVSGSTREALKSYAF